MDTDSISIQIWQQHGDQVKEFICCKVNHEDHCHDILHDVFLKVMEKEEIFRLIEKPSSYVIKMAQNTIIDYYRNQKKVNSICCETKNDSTEVVNDIQLADCCLISFINKLPAKYKEALIFTELEGMSQKKLAEHLDISYTGAKSRVQRGRQMLKEAILACCPYKFDKYGNIISCC